MSCTYQAPVCKSFTYSDWSNCLSSGTQIRTVISSSPTNCQAGNPDLIKTCNYQPLCTDSDWESSLSPTECPQSKIQTKTWKKIGDCNETNAISHLANEKITCDYLVPTCKTFTYSDWSYCLVSSIQTRQIVNSTPDGCIGGNPDLVKACNYSSPYVPINISNVSNEIFGCLNSLSADCYNEPNLSKLNLQKELNKTSINENGKRIIDFLGNNSNMINLSELTIKSGLYKNSSFMIVRGKEFNLTKTIDLQYKGNIAGVCLKDATVDNVSDIINNCTYLSCPSFGEKYNCSILDSSTLTISGLSHSGVIALAGNICGDSVCTSTENCSSCSDDCGTCLDSNGLSNETFISSSSKSSGSSSGGGSSSSNKVISNVSSYDDGSADKSSTEIIKEKITDLYSNVIENKDPVSLSLWVVMILLISALIVLLVIAFVILKIKKKSPSVDDRLNEQIKDLLVEGISYYQQGKIAEAEDIYNQIKQIYSKFNNKNKKIYSEIMDFYNLLSKK